MKHLLALAAGNAVIFAAADQILRGLDPAKAALYAPNAANTFRCLDGSKEIRYNQLNDDYCDCQDGSDEPGTSACHNATFYCLNAGHVPATVPARNVNDGICEPACCDGSDEWSGLTVCPNTCAALAKKAAVVAAKQEAVRKAGAAQRASWSKAGRKQRRDLESSLQQAKTTLATAQQKLKEAEAALKHARDTAPVAKFTKGSQGFEEARVRVEGTVSQLKEAVNGLQARVKAQEERVAALETILRDLKASYNPNFQDMAVKGAVGAFDELPAVQQAAFAAESVLPELLAADVALPSDVCPIPAPATGLGAIWQQLRRYLSEVGVLAEESVADVVADETEPESVRKAAAEVDQRKQELTTAETQERNISDDLAQSYTDNLGLTTALKDALRHIKGECFSTKLGDYDYEVCLLQTLHQKSSNQGSTLVGNFESLEMVNSPAADGALFGTTMQLHYTHGTRCWNGPERSGRVDIECGSENKVLSVREAQKCEYVYRVTSPIACAPGQDGQPQDEIKDEL
jgi:protein kinase C substrate 80K-H